MVLFFVSGHHTDSAPFRALLEFCNVLFASVAKNVGEFALVVCSAVVGFDYDRPAWDLAVP